MAAGYGVAGVVAADAAGFAVEIVVAAFELVGVADRQATQELKIKKKIEFSNNYVDNIA